MLRYYYFIIYSLIVSWNVSNLNAGKMIISSEKIASGEIRCLVTQGNDIYVLIWGNKEQFLERYHDGKFTQIPLIDSNGEKMRTNYFSSIKFDNKGKLWLSCKNKIAKWDNSKWTSYAIDDSVNDFRDYKDFTFDEENNLWILSNYQITKFQDGIFKIVDDYDEVLKLDNGSFTRILHRFHKEAGDLFNYEKIITDLNNKILITMNNTVSDILIYNGVNWDSTKLESYLNYNHRKKITDFIQNKNGDLWYAYDLSDSDPKLGNKYYGALSVQKNNGEWKHFRKADKYPYAFNNDADTAKLALTNDIEIGKDGNLWLASSADLLKIDQEYNLSVINFSDIALESIVFTSALKQTPSFNIEDLYHKISRIAITDDGIIWFSILDNLIRYQPITGIEDDKSENHNSVFPNVIESGEEVRIQNPFSNEIKEITMIDALGREVYQINDWRISDENLTFTFNSNIKGKFWIFGKSQAKNFLYPIIIK